MSDPADPATAPRGMTPVEVIVDVWGGFRPTARAIGVAASTVLRWGQRPSGRIPDQYLRRLLDAAVAQKRRLTLEELVFGRPGIARGVVHSMDRPTAPCTRRKG